MTRILGIILLLVVLRMAVKSFTTQLRAAVFGPPAAPKVPPPQPKAVVAETLVQCATCGTYVAGRRALDAGASTGGFTDCLLQRGAAAVVAVDVGHGQLDPRLRGDGRVTVRERLNVRRLTLDDTEGPVDLVVADLSFISLRTVLDALLGVCVPEGDLVLLVKPQFEAGRAEISKGGGVVRDEAIRRSAVAKIRTWAASNGFVAGDDVESAITGPAGNVEYLLLLRTGP